MADNFSFTKWFRDQYIKEAILREAPDVPTMVIKAVGRDYEEVTDRDELGVFLPQVQFIKAKPSKTAKQNLEKSIANLGNALNNIQDGRQSFLGRIQKIIKVGRLSPKKPIPEEVKENTEVDGSSSQQVVSLKDKDNEN